MIKRPPKDIPEGFSFNTLCKYLQKIEQTTKRIEKTEYLLKMMIRVDLEYPNDLKPLLLLLQNVIREPWEDGPSVLNVGEQLVRKAIQESFGITQTQLRADLIKIGDIGDLAQQYKSKQPKLFVQPQPLTLKSVHESMQQIAEMSGNNSQQQRLTIIQRLFQAGSGLECRFLARMLQSKNRLGVQRKSLLGSLADFSCYKNLVKTKAISGFKPGGNVTIVDYVNNSAQEVLSYQVTNAKIDKLLSAQNDKTNGNNKSIKQQADDSQSDGQSDDLSDSDDETEIKTKHVSQSDIDDANEDLLHQDDQKPNDEILQSIDDIIQYLPNIKNLQFEFTVKNPRLYAHAAASYSFARCPSLVELLNNVCDLRNVHWKLGVPILPMLARPAASYSEALEKADGRKCACEWKYDGFRAQIHVNQQKTQIFSRSQEVMSQRFPEVTTWINKWMKNQDKITNMVLDGEIVPVDDTGKILPFQLLSRRLRAVTDDNKGNVSEYNAVFIVFDIIMLNDHSLMTERYDIRRKILKIILDSDYCQENCDDKINNVQLSNQKLISSVQELENALEDAVKNKTEGLIIKTLSSQYKPDRRSGQWIKLKKDYMDGVGDSFDLVPVAAWRGQGKRTGVFGAFLLASYNTSKEQFETVTQLGTGFSDEQLQRFTNYFTEAMQGLNSQSKPQNVTANSAYTTGNNKPDFWIIPEHSTVWEIKVADLTLSLTHTCSQNSVEGGRGVGARLPRLLHERSDKNIFDCSTSQFVYQRFLAQPGRGNADVNGDDIVFADEASSGSLEEFSESEDEAQ